MVNINLNILNSCSSTNDIAFKAAQKGAKEGDSYLAYEQTNGRGRNNNLWFSMKGNLFLSTIIKPKSNKFNFQSDFVISDLPKLMQKVFAVALVGIKKNPALKKAGQ